jgi:uncharacterized protein
MIINDNKTKTSLLIIAVLLLINTAIAFAEPIPAKPGTNTYVFDYAGLITGADEQEIKKTAKLIDDKTKAQIIVVTVNDLAQMEIEDYALQLFRSWGVGDKEKNNGLLILVNKESLLKNRQGRIRIEVGYGLEGAVNDGKAGAILDTYALPAFETGGYSRGIRDTFMAVSAAVAEEYGLDLASDELVGLQDYSVEESDFWGILPIIAVIIIIILLLGGKHGSGKYRRGPFIGPFIGGSGGGFGGGSSGGGFGGGGFGGGSSGGGGASR